MLVVVAKIRSESSQLGSNQTRL